MEEEQEEKFDRVPQRTRRRQAGASQEIGTPFGEPNIKSLGGVGSDLLPDLPPPYQPLSKVTFLPPIKKNSIVAAEGETRTRRKSVFRPSIPGPVTNVRGIEASLLESSRKKIGKQFSSQNESFESSTVSLLDGMKVPLTTGKGQDAEWMKFFGQSPAPSDLSMQNRRTSTDPYSQQTIDEARQAVYNRQVAALRARHPSKSSMRSNSSELKLTPDAPHGVHPSPSLTPLSIESPRSPGSRPSTAQFFYDKNLDTPSPPVGPDSPIRGGNETLGSPLESVERSRNLFGIHQAASMPQNLAQQNMPFTFKRSVSGGSSRGRAGGVKLDPIEDDNGTTNRRKYAPSKK